MFLLTPTQNTPPACHLHVLGLLLQSEYHWIQTITSQKMPFDVLSAENMTPHGLPTYLSHYLTLARGGFSKRAQPPDVACRQKHCDKNFWERFCVTQTKPNVRNFSAHNSRARSGCVNLMGTWGFGVLSAGQPLCPQNL